jgi:predicted transcriptional regulator
MTGFNGGFHWYWYNAFAAPFAGARRSSGMTLTIEVPEALAARLAPLPESERQRYAIAWMQAGADAEDETDPDLSAEDFPLTPEDIAAIRAGIADAEAGRILDGETVLADLRRLSGRTH